MGELILRKSACVGTGMLYGVASNAGAQACAYPAPHLGRLVVPLNP